MKSIRFGMVLLFFNNVPFAFINIDVDLLLIYFATIMSLISMFQYYNLNKNLFLPESK